MIKITRLAPFVRARIQHSKEKHEVSNGGIHVDEEELRGFLLGLFWARTRVSYRSLQIIGEAPAHKSGSMAAIRGRRQDNLWRTVFGDEWREQLSPAFERGFIRAAQNVWMHYKYKI